MRYRDSPCVDGKLYRLHIHDDHAKGPFEYERQVAPIVGDAVLVEGEESCSACQVVGDLGKHSSNEVSCLGVQKSFGCVADLLVGVGRNSVEFRD